MISRSVDGLRSIALAISIVTGAALHAEEQPTYLPAEISKMVEPIFPAKAERSGIYKGKVKVLISINAAGHVSDYMITAASHEAFIDPVEGVIEQWVFSPALYNGVPVNSIKPIDMAFESSGLGFVTQGTSAITAHFIDLLEDSLKVDLIAKASELDHLPKPLKIVEPKIYADIPEDDRSGVMVFEFFIDKEGRIRLPSLAESEGDDRLAQAALEALSQWRFEPPIVDGEPTAVYIRQKFDFGTATQGGEEP